MKIENNELFLDFSLNRNIRLVCNKSNVLIKESLKIGIRV